MGSRFQSRYILAFAPMLPIYKCRQFLFLIFEGHRYAYAAVVKTGGTLTRRIGLCINKCSFFPAPGMGIHRRRAFFKVVVGIENGIVDIPIPGLPFAPPYDFCPFVYQWPAEIKMVQ